MEDKNQVLLEVEKDLRDEIKMRIKQRDTYYAQAIAFCGALLAFGLTKFGDNAMGGVVLFCGPFVALSYWRLLVESYYVHDKAKLYLKDQVERRLDELVGNGFCSWQRYCAKKKNNSVSGNQKCAVNWIMLVVPPIVFGAAIAFHGKMMGLLTSTCTLSRLWQYCLIGIYGVLGILWLWLAICSYRSMKGKYRGLDEPLNLSFWPSNSEGGL